MLKHKLIKGQTLDISENLQVSLISKNDIPDIFRMLENPKVTAYLFFAPSPDEVYHQYFDPIVEDTKLALVEQRWPNNPVLIVRNTRGAFMGMCGLAQVFLQPGVFEVGFQLPQSAWRQGIASKVTSIIIKIAFNELGAHKLVADCFSQNLGSWRTLEKSGFVREGCQSDFYKIDEHFDDRLLYGLSLAQFHQQTN